MKNDCRRLPLPLIPGVFLNRSSLTPLTFLRLFVGRQTRHYLSHIYAESRFLCSFFARYLEVVASWLPLDFHPSQIAEVELD